MSKLSVALSEKHFDLVVAQGHNQIGNVIAVQIVAGNGNWRTMHRVLRPFFEFAIGATEQDGNLVATRASQYDIGVGIAVEQPGCQRSRFLTDVQDRKSTRLNSSHMSISYAVFCLKK